MKRLMALTLSAFSVLSYAQIPDYVPTDGLVAWYPLDGDANDVGPNQFVGQLSGTTAYEGHLGNDGGSFWFDGNAFVHSPFSTLSTEQGATYTAWVQRANRPGIGYIVSYGNALGSGQSFCLAEGGGDYGLFATAIGWTFDAKSGQFLPLNDWTFVATTILNNEVSIYMNNQVVYNGTIEQPTLQLNGDLRIGVNPSGQDEYWVGAIDDVGVWNRVLSAEEIQEVYIGTPPLEGCTDESACNYDAAAAADDGSCLFLPEASLASLVQLSNSSELEVVVPPGLSSWHWTDGDSNAVRTIQPLQTYVLEGTVGNLPQLGDELEGGLVFAIDTLAETAYIATSEAIGSGSEWGCKFTTTGATASDFGAGWSNTELILNACGEENCAARVASALGTGWHLPSRDELEAIRTTLFDTDLAFYFTDNTYNWYWSSTECSSNSTAATSIHFLDGFVLACNNKDSNPGGVIAINKIERSFCAYADTLRIEIQGEPLCGEGTIWDESTEECVVSNPADTNLDGCVQLNDLLDVLSAYGDCGVEEAPWACGDPLSYQGYDYATVQIGDQCWFAENLRADEFSNGNEVPLGSAIPFGNNVANIDAYGLMYDGTVVIDEGAICPAGWMVSSLSDWQELISFVAANGYSSNESKALRSIDGWSEHGAGWDAFGFNGKPGGFHYNPTHPYWGEFAHSTVSGYWWTTTPSGPENLHAVTLQGNYIEPSYPTTNGMSIRCIKDAE